MFCDSAGNSRLEITLAKGDEIVFALSLDHFVSLSYKEPVLPLTDCLSVCAMFCTQGFSDDMLTGSTKFFSFAQNYVSIVNKLK